MATTNTSSPYQVLPIENGSFEAPTLADGEFTVTVRPEAVTVPGWQAYDPNGLITDTGTDVRAWNPATEQYPNGVPDGENVGYSYVVDLPLRLVYPTLFQDGRLMTRMVCLPGLDNPIQLRETPFPLVIYPIKIFIPLSSNARFW